MIRETGQGPALAGLGTPGHRVHLNDDRREPLTGFASTLATIWRLAAPYFFSEDRLAGRTLLAAVVAIELSLVGIDVVLNQWNARFFNAIQDRNWDNFVGELLFFCVARGGLYRAGSVPALPQSMAADPLAAVADRPLSRPLARRRQPLPHAAARATRPTIRISASPRTSSSSSMAERPASASCRSASVC